MTQMIQEATERRLSKRVLKDLFVEEVKSNTAVLEVWGKCILDVEARYLNGDHYPQKNERLANMTLQDCDDIMTHILYVVSERESMSLSNLMGQCAGVVKNDSEYHRLQTIGEIAYYMACNQLIGMIPPEQAPSGMLTVVRHYTPSSKYQLRHRQAQFLPPMVCKPNELKHNRSSGWMCTDFGSLITKKGNHHEKDISLDVLNKRNATAFKLDYDYLCAVTEQIPEDVINGTPNDDGVVVSLEQYQRYQQETHEATKYLKDTGNRFYFLHKKDKRGRIYSQGYHIGYQQNSYRKGMIDFADEEIVEM